MGMGKESIRQMSLWVTFPNLPIYYWLTENLSRIASCSGKPVCIDRLSAEEGMISCARILIELDVTQPLSEVIKEPNGNTREQ